MKYGQQLGKRSVPEWRAHNILYEELKLEIKELTASPSSFSEERYAHLVHSFTEELQSAKLFVDCKVAEIEYRFQQCDALVRDLVVERDDTKYWQLHWQVQKLAQEIQNLSRFITAQYTGFRKLIKKYRRHAPPEQLAANNDLAEIEHALARKGSFATVDLTPQFLELSVLYRALRNEHFDSFNLHATPVAETAADALAQFDMVMQTTHAETVLRFWIHPENLVQAKVLLLQHMDLVAPTDMDEDHEQTRAIFLDTEDLEFARRQNGPAKLQQVFDGAVYSQHVLAVPPSGLRHTAAAALTEEEVRKIKHGDFGFAETRSMNAQLALGWISTHAAKPISEISSHRTRFVSSVDNAWAAIDANVQIVGTRNAFPYAVLEVRAQSDDVDWLHQFKSSHLVYPVSSSFSLYGWTLLRTQTRKIIAMPRWLDELDSGKDIRREAEIKDTARSNPKHSGSNLNLREGDLDVPRARYWNEFDDGEDFEDHTQFIDEEDEALRRARVAAKIATPVYALGESMRRQWKNLFERRSSESTLGSAMDTASLLTGTSFDSSPIANDTAQFSPRIRPRVISSYGSVQTSRDAESNYQQRRSDQGLTLITFLCFCLAIGIVGLVYTILLTEDVGLLPFGLKLALSLFLTIALCLAAAGNIAFNYRSSQEWMAQAIVQATLFSIVCFGVGGIATIIGPQL